MLNLSAIYICSIVILISVSGCKKQEVVTTMSFQVQTNRTQVYCYTIGGGSNSSGLGYTFVVSDESGNKLATYADYNVSTNHNFPLDAPPPNYYSGSQYTYQISMWCGCIDSVNLNNVCSGMGYTGTLNTGPQPGDAQLIQIIKTGTFTPSSNSSSNVIPVNLN